MALILKTFRSFIFILFYDKKDKFINQNLNLLKISLTFQNDKIEIFAIIIYYFLKRFESEINYFI